MSQSKATPNNDEATVTRRLVATASQIEKEVDQRLAKFDELNDMTFENFTSEIDGIRVKRLANLKREAELRKLYFAQGHGRYDEIFTENDFFEVTKSSPRVAIHFYDKEKSRETSQIIDILLKRMCIKHIETRFIKVELSRVPFLRDNFKLKTVPCVLVSLRYRVRGVISNFDNISDIEKHSYKLLEWRLARLEALDYDEDLNSPPEAHQPKPKKKNSRTIRGPNYDSSDSDYSD